MIDGVYMKGLNGLVGNSKPHAAINSLMSNAITLGNEKILKKGCVFSDFSKRGDDVFFITSGKVGVYRKSDRLLIQEGEAPTITGIVNLFHQQESIILKAHSELCVIKIPGAGLIDVIESQNLWHDVADILAWMIYCYNTHYTQQVGLNSYQIVKYHLLLLNKRPLAERFTTTAVKFITDRTLLSRSGVMNILKRLDLNGYIIVDNGRLVSIINLPDNL